MEKNIEIPSEDILSDKEQYLSMRLNGQMFGMLVDCVEDILSPQNITPVPLSPPEVSGALNLRGRIVTSINLRAVLEMDEPEEEINEYRSVVVNLGGNLYSIILDKVTEVISFSDSEIERVPENLSEKWKGVSSGVHSLAEELMVILDASKLLNIHDEENNEEEGGS